MRSLLVILIITSLFSFSISTNAQVVTEKKIIEKRNKNSKEDSAHKTVKKTQKAKKPVKVVPTVHQ